MSPTASVQVDPRGLSAFAQASFEATGMSPRDAAAASQVLVRTTLRGVDSHGIAYLHAYIAQLEAGGADPRAELQILRQTPSTALLDADGGNGLAMMSQATQLALEKARLSASATVLVRNSNHFGAAGHYALVCAEAGMIALVLGNSNPIMQVPGARTRSIGNGATAYGIPVPDGPPIVLDIALSVVAGGKVRMAQRRGESVPPGWIVDAQGNPTQDPADFLDRGGALLPVGAHKGYGLTVLGEILAGVLAGASTGPEVISWLKSPTLPARIGHYIYVLDPEAFMAAGEFQARLASYRDGIQGAPRADGVERIYLPGEIEHDKEQNSSRVLELESVVWDGLTSLAQRLGLGATLDAALASS
ncbi:MAG TPA: Ldh family oxidoreductase [Candidatus Nitrosotalea sp.]|nr:Ldh family oxidoreductase [Candidatus Nitrosotalea sp.]